MNCVRYASAIEGMAIMPPRRLTGGFMARFFFHLTHKAKVRDEAGVELDSLHEAKCHAVKMIADVLCKEPEKLWEADVYSVEASNADGLMLFNVEMYATLAPVLRKPLPKA